jgi:hypothetical protein
MNSIRLARLAGALSLLAGGLSSCLQEPSYSTTPSIEFESIKRKRFTQTGQIPVDSIFVTIRFQDGDGDLGLNDTEIKSAPYVFPSRYSSNYFIEPYVLVPLTGKYVKLADIGRTTAGAYNARFDHPSTTTDTKAAALKGTLTRAFGFGYGDVFKPGEIVRFDVNIADRALHESNIITTDTVGIKVR